MKIKKICRILVTVLLICLIGLLATGRLMDVMEAAGELDARVEFSDLVEQHFAQNARIHAH